MLLLQKIWRATINRFLTRIDNAIEQRYVQKSFVYPMIRRGGRETFIYYEKGRSTSIGCDLALGCKNLDLLIYNELPLKWRDTEEYLTSEESKKVYSILANYLTSNKIRWAYSDTIKKTA